MKRLLFIMIGFFASLNFVCAQNIDSSLHVKISLLTCSPGEELYASFGHTGIRIVDSAAHTDVVFNYGTFDFAQPNFYLKFIRGKLNYMISENSFDDFMEEYRETQRSVAEQDLNLNQEEKKFVIQFLNNNYLPQNRNYKYDFLYDNCATRIRDLLFNKISGVTLTAPIVQPNTTFRDLIYFYLDRSGQPWSKLGIDILLGSSVDKKLDNNSSMFLPDFLSKAANAAVIHGRQPYVLAERKLIDTPPLNNSEGKFAPLIVFIIVCIALVLLYFLSRNNFFFTHLLDSLLLYLTGLLGLFILFMWFGTDHQTCLNNYNIMWAIPTNFFAAFFIWKKRRWLKIYFILASIVTIILLSGWRLLPQHFNIALLPFCVLMLYRYSRLAIKN